MLRLCVLQNAPSQSPPRQPSPPLELGLTSFPPLPPANTAIATVPAANGNVKVTKSLSMSDTHARTVYSLMLHRVTESLLIFKAQAA